MIEPGQRSESHLDSKASGGRGWIVSLFLVAVLLGLGFVVWLSTCASGSQLAGAEATSVGRATRTPKAGPLPSPVSLPLHVGIVAGHWQSDSGAVCPDGLMEVTINLDVAYRVAAILQTEGYDAEVLAEFAPELSGYVADAFVSIHTDSCEIEGASGFKVARVSGSAIPVEEDRLVDCLVVEYGQTTGLVFHEDSITFDMTQYHAFGEIDPLTPAAIIELGFMGSDRWLLTEHSYDVARGVARGIACFLEGD
jgi:N-acetylmuramoyl-L-alanine amidase